MHISRSIINPTYMQTLQKNNLTKTTATIAAGLLLVIYGYVCRATGTNFFWESKSIAWAVVFIGIIAMLFNMVQVKRNSRNNLSSKKSELVSSFSSF